MKSNIKCPFLYYLLQKDASISNESLSTQEYEDKDEQDELLSMEDQLPGDIKQDSDSNEKQTEIGDAPMSDSTDEIRCNGQQKTKSQEPVSESESISENNVSVVSQQTLVHLFIYYYYLPKYNEKRTVFSFI